MISLVSQNAEVMFMSGTANTPAAVTTDDGF